MAYRKNAQLGGADDSGDPRRRVTYQSDSRSTTRRIASSRYPAFSLYAARERHCCCQRSACIGPRSCFGAFGWRSSRHGHRKALAPLASRRRASHGRRSRPWWVVGWGCGSDFRKLDAGQLAILYSRSTDLLMCGWVPRRCREALGTRVRVAARDATDKRRRYAGDNFLSLPAREARRSDERGWLMEGPAPCRSGR